MSYPGATILAMEHRESRRNAYRRPDGRMIDLTSFEERGVYLTQADVNRMSPEEIDKILRENGL
ncbi:hypothetical protein MPNTM1_02526 [Mycolicibacterium parafortuitum]|uniref:hypothetical protein n=1 Tax=Mycolicibacterium parafortuitum TaxID=39692 RepID=UPI0032C42A47